MSALEKQRSSEAFSWRTTTEGEPDFSTSSIPGAGERRATTRSRRYAERARPLSQHHQQIRKSPWRLMKRRNKQRKRKKDTITDFQMAFQGLFNSSWNSVFSVRLLQVSTTTLCAHTFSFVRAGGICCVVLGWNKYLKTVVQSWTAPARGMCTRSTRKHKRISQAPLLLLRCHP